MSNKLQIFCQNLMSKRGHGEAPALMTHVVVGYPDLETSIEIVKEMASSGASLVELQIPFSDPIADGQSIMHANEVACANQISITDCLKAVEQLSKEIDIPILLMSYFNPIFNYKDGLSSFCKEAARVGVSGIIVADIPPEEDKEGYWSTSKENDIIPIPIISPVTNKIRLKKISSISDSGFVYCTSTTGTTGAREKLNENLSDYLSKVKEDFNIPIAVGFGISKKEQIKELSGDADIAVVGSACINIIKNNIDNKADKSEIIKEVGLFIRDLTSL